MSRAQRLLELIQILPGHRFPVAGTQLATQLGISLRTLYRDIRTLQEQGANIEGAAGLDYVLRPGFMLSPLMFSQDEIEALVLGLFDVMWLGEMPMNLRLGRSYLFLNFSRQSTLGIPTAIRNFSNQRSRHPDHRRRNGGCALRTQRRRGAESSCIVKRHPYATIPRDARYSS